MTASNGSPSKLRKLRPWLITALLFAAVVGLIMWLHSTSTGAPAAQGGRGGRPGPGQMAAGQGGTAVTVSVAPVTRGDLPVHYHALGTVTAFNTVNVTPRVSGELVKVPFQEGQEVKAGDLLAVVDPRTYKAALAQAEGTLMQNQAQLKNAQIDLQRYKGLYAEDSIAKQTLDTQEAQVRQYEGTLKTNQGQVDDARLNLTFTQVRAPISGRLGLRQVDIGNLVTSGDTTPLVVITQVKPISVVFSLPQQQLGTVARAAERPQQAGGGRGAGPQPEPDPGHRRAEDPGQPDRHHHRHRQAQGRLRERRRQAVPQPVRQRAPAGRDPAGRADHSGQRRAARHRRYLRLPGRRRQQGQPAPTVTLGTSESERVVVERA